MTTGKKLEVPNYTQVPNFVLGNPYGGDDEVGLLPDMDGSELKVFLIVTRITIGWHKRESRISIRRLAKVTGLSTSTVQKAVKKLLDKNLIYVKKGKGINRYGLLLHNDGVAIIDTVVSKTDTPSSKENSKQKVSEEDLYLLSLPKAEWEQALRRYYPCKEPNSLARLLAEFATLFKVNIPLFTGTSQRTHIARGYHFMKSCEGKDPMKVLRMVKKRYASENADWTVSNLGSLANYASSVLAKDRGGKAWGEKSKSSGGWDVQ